MEAEDGRNQVNVLEGDAPRSLTKTYTRYSTTAPNLRVLCW